MYARDPEVLLSGPAGTGKSRACLEKLHMLAGKFPGMRGLLLRKTRESLTESALVTFETMVVEEGHPILRGPRRDTRKAYEYPNGSVIVVGGLRQSGRDLTQKVMSTEYDVIYVQEAIELQESEWEKATTRLRHGVTPYQQLMADTNPDAPTHWLKRRCDAGRTLLLDSRYEDNPLLWDAKRGRWTAGRAEYIAKLDALTGARLQRLRYGRWVQAEGVVYEEWDPAIHVVAPFSIPPTWPRYWSVDFGFTNPFVCQWWAEDGDARLYRYRELYQTHRLVEDHAKEMLALSKSEPRPRAIICDTDAEDRATLQRHLGGLMTMAAHKVVSPGIQAVATRLRKAADGKPRLFLFRNALVRRDPLLEQQRRPACTEQEFDSFIWDLSSGRKGGEKPVKEHDHGMDATRYMVANRDLQTTRTSAPSAHGGVTMPPMSSLGLGPRW
jgi:phage terminase large subunit